MGVGRGSSGEGPGSLGGRQVDAAHGRVSRTHTAAVKRLRVAWGAGGGRGGPLGASRAGLGAQTEGRWALSSRGVLRAHAVHISREGGIHPGPSPHPQP